MVRPSVRQCNPPHYEPRLGSSEIAARCRIVLRSPDFSLKLFSRPVELEDLKAHLSFITSITYRDNTIDEHPPCLDQELALNTLPKKCLG